MKVGRLHDSEGVHSTKSAASDMTTSGRHIHTSPDEAVKAGRLIVAKALA